MPKRVQLSRARGWRKPDGVVVVARPSKWGNPFRVGHPDPITGEPITTRAEAVERYARHSRPGGAFALDLDAVRRELGGRDLACWCPLDGPCHADVLLRIASTPPS